MITQTTELNLIPNGSPIRIHVDQYDEGAGRLVFRLYEDDVEYSPVGATAVIQGCKPDGRGFDYNCTLVGNTVTADLTLQMTAVNGSVRSQIVVTESDGRIGSFAFIIEVQRSALPSDTDMSESEYQIIEQAILATQDAVLDAEAWAVGERGGDPVGPSDPTYHNNAEYWAYMASQYAQGGIIYKGSCLFANIPVSGMNNGDMWNIEDDFTTDARFEEGAGIACVAGTNIVWNGSKWDLFAIPKTGVQSFNGRTGIVTPQAGDYDLTDLGDIVITSATDGQVLTWDATAQKWVNGNASGGSASLAGLDDVSLSSPTNGQVLKYNSTSQEWENANESGGGSGDYVGLYGDTLVGSDLNNITSVGNYYNDGTVTVSHYPQNAIITATSAFRLTVEKMGDSASTNLRQTYVLDNSVDFVFERHRTNGSWSSWQKILTSYSNIGELDNVDISSPTNNQVLTYNSTTQKWENANAQGGSGDYVGLYGMTEIQSSDGQGSTLIDLDTYTSVGNYYCNGKGRIQPHYNFFDNNQSGGQSRDFPDAVFVLVVKKLPNNNLTQELTICTDTNQTSAFFRLIRYKGISGWTYWARQGSTTAYGIYLTVNGIHDTSLSSLATGDVLVYNNTNIKWENKPLSGYISNPNLLDNPWFTINQRGQSSYTTDNAYNFDRWKLYTNGATDCSVARSDDVVTLTKGAGYFAILAQLIPDDLSSSFVGKVATMSLLLSNGDILSGTSVIKSGENTVFYTEGGTRIDLQNPTAVTGASYAVRIHNTSSTPLQFKAIKLELGSISTLALDTAPNYATELLKCQRYYQRLENKGYDTFVGIAYSSTANYIRTKIPYTVSMRTTPSLILTGKMCVWGLNYGIDLTSISGGWYQSDNNGLSLSIGNTTGTTVGSFYYCMLPPNSVLELTADL